MIKYRLVLKDSRKRTLKIASGEVTDTGKITIETDGNQPPVTYIEVSWERNEN